MSDATPNLHVDFGGAQTTDVKIDAAGRDRYEGVAFGQVKELLTELADKEPQRQGLLINAVEQGYARAADAVEDAEGRTSTQIAQVVTALHRVATLLQWLTGAMLVQAVFTALALFLGLWALLALVGPRLVAEL